MMSCGCERGKCRPLRGSGVGSQGLPPHPRSGPLALRVKRCSSAETISDGGSVSQLGGEGVTASPLQSPVRTKAWIVLLFLFQSVLLQAADNKNILLLGDSIGAGYGLPQEQSFAAIIQRKLAAEKLNYRVVNASVSGDTTASGLRRINWLLKRKADILLIELGGNDGLRGIQPDATKSNLTGIIDRARKKYPDIKIILAGMQMPGNMGKDYTTKYRAVFPAVAKEKQISLIPFLLDGVGADPKMNQPDLIHPNARGHIKVAENVWSVLFKMVQK